MNSKPRIVIPVWKFLKSGGMRVLTKMANCFYKFGYDVVMISYYKTDDPYYEVECPIQFVDNSGNVVAKNEPISLKNIIDFNYDKVLRHFALKKALNRLSSVYDTVIANYHLTAYAVNDCDISNKFYYIQAYEAWYDGKMACIYNYFAKKSYSLNLTRIVNADLYKDYKEINSKYVVPPGLDLEIYYPKKKDDYWDGNRTFVIGHIGRTEEWKGSTDVALAVKILQDEGINICYKVAFNPPNEGICNFNLIKPDGDDNLAAYYRFVDVMVAPGHIQLGAIHYPVIEAMACGTPVITTGYYPANNNNAYIVEVKSPKEIANAIKLIMSDYSMALEKVDNAVKEIEMFSWDNVSRKMLDIIEEYFE